MGVRQRELPAERPGHDADQVGLLGHSAGAGIVAAVATDPQFLEHAGSVWQAQMDAFADKLRGAGVDVQIIDATGYSHGDVNQLIGSTTDPIMTKPATAFFERCFAKG